MGRNKLPLKKIDNPCRRKITYSKRRDGIIKKATELSVLCDTDVGVLMYSPHGRLTTFSSNGRIEDIFLRYFDQSSEQGGTVEKEGYLYQNLKRLKHEKEMLEQIAKMEVLLEKLNEIRQKLQEGREKMRSYNPDVVDINAIHDANAHRQFLFDAIQNIEKLSMEIFHEPIDLQKSESLQVTLPATRDAHLTAEELVYANGNRNLSQDDHQPKEAHLPAGPHLTLEYLRTQKHWNLQGRGQGNA
ncbi:AGAMOUS-LIKE MADS-BOX PROTEIN AGL104 [Salix purpurea]|uniref:AGAMOUS-LIKE MADS-BOX PROTEIN AGL104 n=1 Tax=Salix purpurea TaxID=77065 RepID=A0A9Q0ZNI4_SALPP|nr:AGAMOUS-LIKE MADS-BOX PROTEIN AGL104 [Salix purpurea]